MVDSEAPTTKIKKVLVWPKIVSVYREKKTKFILIANNINSNDIIQRIKFLRDKKTPKEPIKNKSVETIKFINIIVFYLFIKIDVNL